MSATSRADQPEYFPLKQPDSQGLLLASRTLVIDPLHEMALLIDWQARQLVSACTFFEEELGLLLPMLRAWPAFVPYGRLLALLETIGPVEPEHEAALARQYTLALEAGTQDTLLGPLRARLADPQQKLAIFGLKLVAVYEQGILLAQAPQPKPASDQGAYHG